MTLSTEHCIQVAEKVWLITVIPDGKSTPITELDKIDIEDYVESEFNAPDAPNGWLFASEVPKRVNSWQGFGRTVEGMDKKKWWFNKSVVGVYFYHYNGMNRHTTMIRDGGLTMESLWEATHLAALEAIDDKS